MSVCKYAQVQQNYQTISFKVAVWMSKYQKIFKFVFLFGYFDGNGADGYFPPPMIGRKGESLWQKQDTFHASIYFAALRKTVTNRHATYPILQFLKYKYPY